MKITLLFFLIFALAVGCLFANREARRDRKRYRPLNVFSAAKLKKAAKKNKKILLNSVGKNPLLKRLKHMQPQPLTANPPNPPSGISSPIRIVAQSRPQVRDANFGHSNVPPGPVPDDQVIRPEADVPPDPSIQGPLTQDLKELSRKERNQIAQNFFVMARYEPFGLSNDSSTLIRLMQRNYGLEETGELDDVTITYMMAPRCGYQDPPANYQTFLNNPKWDHNPVTYRFAGYTPDVSPCQTRNILKRALRVWEEVIELDFEEVQSDPADIIIYFGYREHGDGYPFDERNGLLAHAFTAGDVAISGDTHFDEAEHWTLGDGHDHETYYGNANGASCVFPFIFENQEYTTCITQGREDGLEWCATTRNYDRDQRWGFCPQETLFTYGGNGEGNPCRFPFIFRGQSYESCTLSGRTDGYRWCATTDNFDQDGQWGFCPNRAHGTYDGNSDGAACVFPFVYDGDTYSECTVVGRSDFKPWCATTADFDRDGKYGLCHDSGYNLFFVAAHEFGHVIGLDHSFDQSALMYPTYQSFRNFRLPNDDVRGAQSLYRPRTSRLAPLVLERCGGDLTATDGVSTTEPPSTTTPDPTPPPTALTICGGRRITAMFELGREQFVFKGSNFWRMFDFRGEKRGPFVLREQWPGAPSSVDAIYQRPQDDAIVMFKGSRHWVYDGFNLRGGYPKPVSVLGLPKDGSIVVNGALNWKRSKNRRKTYFFVGDSYYRYDERKNKMDKKYPKPMGIWARVPNDIDAAMVDSDVERQSLFVKGETVHILNNYKVQVTETKPVDVLFGCREEGPAPLPIVSRSKNQKLP